MGEEGPDVCECGLVESTRVGDASIPSFALRLQLYGPA